MADLLKKPDNILYSVSESPSLGMVILLAVTHVALIFDAVVFIPNVLGKVTGASLEQIRFSCFIKYFRHIVTPAVGGIVILLVSVNLIPIGIDLWQGGDPQGAGFGSLENYLVGFVTMGSLLALMVLEPGP